MFSIITATYNREHILPRLYESLCNQKFVSFEWIIVDDGSSDRTIELVAQWQAKSNFTIKLLAQKNSGKHRAINAGVAIAESKWSAIIDSDDWISNNCLSRVRELIDQHDLDLRDDVAALILLSSYSDGTPLGSPFPADVSFGRNYLFYDKFQISGDKFDFYKTSVLKHFKFPEIPHERFISEGIVWNRINEKYLSCFVNESHQFVEYQSDGLTSNSFINRSKSPIGACLYYKEAVARPVSVRAKIRHISNYFRFALHAWPRISFFPRCNKLLYVPGLLIGSVLFSSDYWQIRSKKSIRCVADRC